MNVKPIITFVAGVAAGAVGTYLTLRKYFQERLDESIKEERALFAKLAKEQREGKTEEPKPVADTPKDEPQHIVDPKERGIDMEKTYANLLFESGYTSKEESCIQNPPFQIPQSEFGKVPGQLQVHMNYFPDEGILCDSRNGKIYEELDEVIGREGCGILQDEEVPASFYIRNFPYKLDIHVGVIQDSYYKDIYQ